MERGTKVYVGIRLPFATQEQRDALYAAEKALGRIGVTFDTGTDGSTRDWEFDWSLKGATVQFSGLPKEETKD